MDSIQMKSPKFETDLETFYLADGMQNKHSIVIESSRLIIFLCLFESYCVKLHTETNSCTE